MLDGDSLDQTNRNLFALQFVASAVLSSVITFKRIQFDFVEIVLREVS